MLHDRTRRHQANLATANMKARKLQRTMEESRARRFKAAKKSYFVSHGASSGLKTMLRAHYRKRAITSKRHYCTVCQEAFDGPSHLRRHNESNVHQRKVIASGRFHCTVCQTSFASAHERQQHDNSKAHQERLAMDDEQRAVADRAFALKQQKKESGKFYCTICERGFQDTEGLRKHKTTTMHQKKVGIGDEQGSKADHIEHSTKRKRSANFDDLRIYVGEKARIRLSKDFYCTLCEKAFGDKQELKKHDGSDIHRLRKLAIDDEHLGKVTMSEEGYHCHSCDQTLKSRQIFNKHCKSKRHLEITRPPIAGVTVPRHPSIDFDHVEDISDHPDYDLSLLRKPPPELWNFELGHDADASLP